MWGGSEKDEMELGTETMLNENYQQKAIPR